MPSADLLLDTSCAVALLAPDHAAHAAVEAACAGLTLGLAGYALFETLAVLTRTPGIKVSIADAVALIEDNFPANRWPTAAVAAALPGSLKAAGIDGGRIYDALVAAAAAEAGLPLLTLDTRAQPTYQALGADFRLLT